MRQMVFKFFAIVLCSAMIQTSDSDNGTSPPTAKQTPYKESKTLPSSAFQTPDKPNSAQKIGSNVVIQGGPVEPPLGFNKNNRPIHKNLFSNESEQDEDMRNLEVSKNQRGKDQYRNDYGNIAFSSTDFDEGDKSALSSMGGASGNGMNEHDAVSHYGVGSGFVYSYQQNNMVLQEDSYEDVSTSRPMNNQNIEKSQQQLVADVEQDEKQKRKKLLESESDELGFLEKEKQFLTHKQVLIDDLNQERKAIAKQQRDGHKALEGKMLRIDDKITKEDIPQIRHIVEKAVADNNSNGLEVTDIFPISFQEIPLGDKFEELKRLYFFIVERNDEKIINLIIGSADRQGKADEAAVLLNIGMNHRLLDVEQILKRNKFETISVIPSVKNRSLYEQLGFKHRAAGEFYKKLQ